MNYKFQPRFIASCSYCKEFVCLIYACVNVFSRTTKANTIKICFKRNSVENESMFNFADASRKEVIRYMYTGMYSGIVPGWGRGANH